MLLKSFMIVMVILLKLHETQASFAKQGCQETCGNITIPYPFGVGAGCYLNDSFEVFCNESARDQDRPPLRFANNQQFPISEISMDSVRVVDESTYNCTDFGTDFGFVSMNLDQYFFFSQDDNLFVAVGCNISAKFFDSSQIIGSVDCESICTETIPILGSASNCTGLNGCCQRSVPNNVQGYVIYIYYNNKTEKSCSNAFIAEKSASIPFGKSNLQLPLALNWVVPYTTCSKASQRGDSLCGNNSYCIDSTKGLGYNCRCKQGYKGNPYLPNGCQGSKTCVNATGSYEFECSSSHSHKSSFPATIASVIGLSAFIAIGYWTYIKFRRIKKNEIKKKLFEKNGGHQLKKKISDNKSCVVKIKVYAVEEMEKATENFSRSKILGKGGQGTVYKGLLPDKTVVAIKKSNVVQQVELFVNEIVILAQLNHRNIVKLLGCCLEYEVPLLVYEYLSNDTLSQHLHDGEEFSKFSWNDRIRIAKEVAGALAYLHSYTSPSIFHRDIKPSNILLDENYKAVVSDFGLSRSVPLNRSYLTTQIKGTFGYLDPEYYESGQLTAKSDVYSFGVVLIELLTRKKAISSTEFNEGLVPKFKYAMKHNCVVEILDKQIVQEETIDDVFLVAKLAKRCIKTKGQKRPSMKDVVTDLDNLREQPPELGPTYCNKHVISS